MKGAAGKNNKTAEITDFRIDQCRESPKQPGQSNDEDQSQAVTDVHRAQEVSLLPLELSDHKRAALVPIFTKPRKMENRKLRLSGIAGTSDEVIAAMVEEWLPLSFRDWNSAVGSFLDQIPAD